MNVILSSYLKFCSPYIHVYFFIFIFVCLVCFFASLFFLFFCFFLLLFFFWGGVVVFWEGCVFHTVLKHLNI